jgi:type I restriction enzyme, R subunit
VDNFDAFIEELKKQPCPAVGELFVFVDECHRTQSGKLHKTMKALLPNAVFIGFTGTPLLKADRQTTSRSSAATSTPTSSARPSRTGRARSGVRGPRHRPAPGSQDKIDQWFEAEDQGPQRLAEGRPARAVGHHAEGAGLQARMERVVKDIVFDFERQAAPGQPARQRDAGGGQHLRGLPYYELFQKTAAQGPLRGGHLLQPAAQDLTKEDTGAEHETDKQFIYNTYTALLKDVDARPGKTKTETYEDDAKKVQSSRRAAPADRGGQAADRLRRAVCTYLYIDKSMQDHGLFQAICRTNRLDGEDKPFGYIVDYKDLFKKVAAPWRSIPPNSTTAAAEPIRR